MSAPTYEIRTVRDFLAVPEDRIGECLREFAICLEMARASEALLDSTAHALLTNEVADAIEWRFTRFEWIDDGARTVTLNIDVADSGAPAPGEQDTP